MYTITVKTGTVENAGTDSVISLKLSNRNNENLEIKNLEFWGAMEPGHDYYEKGNVDVFTGTAQGFDSPLCFLQLTSDGSNKWPGWYCEYVNVVVSGQNVSYKQNFRVQQWLALDESPYTLTTLRDNCPSLSTDYLKCTTGNVKSTTIA